MQVMICYATTEGQTRKIAEYVADLVRSLGHDADVQDASTAGEIDLSAYQAAILAGSVHLGRYQAALIHQIKLWSALLNTMPTAFISVSLSAASDDPHVRSEIDECAQSMLHEAGWMPSALLHAGGALRFAKYDFFRRWIARLLANQMEKDVDPLEDREYTDWSSVKEFVERFIGDLNR